MKWTNGVNYYEDKFFDKPFELYNDPFRTESSVLEVTRTIEKFILECIDNYNTISANIQKDIEKNGKISYIPENEHERYLYSVMWDFMQAKYPKNLLLSNGWMNKTDSSDTLPDFEEQAEIHFIVNAGKTKYTMREKGLGTNEEYVMLNKSKALEAYEVYYRFGILPIIFQLKVPNVYIQAFATDFLNNFFRQFLHRHLQYVYETPFVNLVRHLIRRTPPQSSMDNTSYILTYGYSLPITDAIIIKNDTNFVDINIKGSYRIDSGPRFPLPKMKVEYIEPESPEEDPDETQKEN